MENLNWGGLDKYFTTDLLDLTNIAEFIDQQTIDTINQKLATSKNGVVSFVDKNGQECIATVNAYEVKGNNKYSVYTRTKNGGMIFANDNEMSGKHFAGMIDCGEGIVNSERVENQFGTWKYLSIRIGNEKRAQEKGTFGFYHDMAFLMEQDYDGSIKYFKGKLSSIKTIVKRHNLARFIRSKTPHSFAIREQGE